MDTAVVSQAHIVVKALRVKSLKHIINRLVGEGGKHDTLALLTQPFDDLGNDARLAGTRWSVYQQVVLHLHSSLDCQVLLGVEVCSTRNGCLVEQGAHFACYKPAQMRIGL